ncbi:MAG: glycosyltransferase family 4 protein [Phycisphaerae bacterium]|nr:glycosyltransferase family 4 protein [Phycisphaerae bacterium]
MKLLIISNMYPTRRNPMSGVFISRQAEYLLNSGIECSFIVPCAFAPWPLYHLPKWGDYSPLNTLVGPDEFAARQIRYLRPPGMWFSRFEGKFMAAAVLSKAVKWHKEKKFNAVLGVSMWPNVQATLAIGKKLNLPVASLAIGSDVMVYTRKMPVLWKHLGNMLSQIDLAMGVSNMICARMSETGKCKKEPICVYLGRDTELFKPAENKESIRQSLGISPGEIVGVFVGAMVATKGMNELVVASKKLLAEYPNFRLICVGDGHARSDFESLKDDNGSGRIILPGRVVPNEVVKYLQAGDFMVFPSYSEGMPQSVLEAMNCGLPVVATKVGGIPEAVIDGQTGLLVDEKNSEQLIAAMDRMIVDAEFRTQAGQECLKYVREKFDPDSNSSKMAKALLQLAK